MQDPRAGAGSGSARDSASARNGLTGAYDYVSPGFEVPPPTSAFPRVVPGDPTSHSWPYLRAEIPHTWYVDARHPTIGVVNRDEATLLHAIARRFSGRRALEIGGWVGWSSYHLALAGVDLDVVDPAYADDELRSSVEASLGAAGVGERVQLVAGRSPEVVDELARGGGRWSLFFIDGDHDGGAPTIDVLACLAHAEDDCAFVLHDVVSPDVAEAVWALKEEGFRIDIHHTAQIVAVARRGAVERVPHVPDPRVDWELPAHLAPADWAEEADASRPRWLVDVVDDGVPTGRPPTVCLVTNELVGPFKNGGIGTATSGMASALASAGLEVTVLYTGSVWTPDVDLDMWRRHFADRGLNFDAIEFDAMRSVVGPVRDHGFALPWLVREYLLQHQFDVVHVNDCCGDVGISLVAKRLGLAFREALFVTTLHGPSRWVLDMDQRLPRTLLMAAFDASERLSIECSDVVLCPSEYMLSWLAEAGFRLPDHAYLQQYTLPPRPVRRTTEVGAVVPDELVFFGRLEERKGIPLFCDALDRAGAELAERGATVTFLGKSQTVAGGDALMYLNRRARRWPFRYRFLTNLGQPEALAYLETPGRVAVMPSPADNSPCTVYEALAERVPFLAARTGGIPELIDDSDAREILFEPTPSALAETIRTAVTKGVAPARFAVDPGATTRTLLSFHAGWERFLPEPRAVPGPTRWAAAVVDHRAGGDLSATLSSIATCPWLRRVIVLDHTSILSGAAAFDVVDVVHDGPTAVRRAIATIAEEDLLLVHSGVRILPEQVARALGALDAADLDGLVPMASVTSDQGARLFASLGGTASVAYFDGVTTAGTMIVRRRSVLRAMRGRSLPASLPFLGIPDWCVAAGQRIWPYPERLAEIPPGWSPETVRDLPARVAAYAAAPENDRYYLLSNGGGPAFLDEAASWRRRVALRLSDGGLSGLVAPAARALRLARTARAWAYGRM